MNLLSQIFESAPSQGTRPESAVKIAGPFVEPGFPGCCGGTSEGFEQLPDLRPAVDQPDSV